MVDKLRVACWPTIMEHSEVWQEIPGGSAEIEQQTEKRAERQRLAADSLSELFKKAKKRAGSETATTKIEAYTVES
jgi:hypothetical protein